MRIEEKELQNKVQDGRGMISVQFKKLLEVKLIE